MQLSFKKAKEFFFDRQVVKSTVDKEKRSVFARLGGFVRTTARRSIRKARRMKPEELSERQLEQFRASGNERSQLPLKASEPGEPPRSRRGDLKRGILFAWDPKTQSVVAGPTKFGDGTDAPEKLELGGQAEATGVEFEKPTDSRPATEKQIEAFVKKREAGELKAQRQRSRKRRFRFKLRKRPYMSPALEAVRPKIPDQFKDLIK